MAKKNTVAEVKVNEIVDDGSLEAMFNQFDALVDGSDYLQVPVDEFLDTIWEQFDSWVDRNPYTL
jgi:hypothetical protein